MKRHQSSVHYDLGYLHEEGSCQCIEELHFECLNGSDLRAALLDYALGHLDGQIIRKERQLKDRAA